MEFLEGEAILQLLRLRGTLTEEETTRIVMQMCDGLEEVHAKGMVHWDLKPANIFPAKTGGLRDVVKIVDFGLATMASATSSDNAAAVCGTPAYMTPEQIRNDKIDGRADIYAIGCVMYECLISEPPFVADSLPRLLDLHLHAAISLEALPETRLRSIIQHCVNKEPTERYADVRLLRSDLHASVYRGNATK